MIDQRLRHAYWLILAGFLLFVACELARGVVR